MKTNTTTNQQHTDSNITHDNIILTLNDLTQQQIFTINKHYPNSLIQKIDTLPISKLNFLTYSDIDYITNQILNTLIDIYLNTDYNIYLIIPDNPAIAYYLSQLIHENTTPRLKDKIIPIYIIDDDYIIELWQNLYTNKKSYPLNTGIAINKII